MSQKLRCTTQWADRNLNAYHSTAAIQLVSVHKHVVNIAVEGWPHLLMIVDPSLPRAPATVGLTSCDFSRFLSFVQRCEDGKYSPGIAMFASLNEEYVIDWSSAPLYSFSPPLFTPADVKDIAAASSVYCQWLLELDGNRSASTVLFDIEGDDDYFRREIQTNFPALVHAMLTDNSEAFIACSANLIGLGRGATPTGDDLIYGACMAWHFSRSLHGMPLGRPALSEDVRSKTTLLGRHMLEMGRLGLAPEPVLKFLLSVYTGRPDCTTLQEVCKIGGSTGLDICIGVLFYINSLSTHSCK